MTIFFDIEEDGELTIEDTEFGGMSFSKIQTKRLYNKLHRYFNPPNSSNAKALSPNRNLSKSSNEDSSPSGRIIGTDIKCNHENQ